MFVVTLNRKSTGRLARAVLSVGLVLALACTVKNRIFSRQETASVARQNFEMTTTQQMADYILSKGYTVDLQSAQVKEVRIPKKFDAEFNNFNECTSNLMH